MQFEDKDSYDKNSERLFQLLADSDGNDEVILYLAKEKASKKLPANRNICANEKTLRTLYDFLGSDNVKVVEKSIVGKKTR